MRGFAIILAYILGNEKARNWCMKKICEASVAIDKGFKQTPLGKIIKGDEKNDDVRKIDE